MLEEVNVKCFDCGNDLDAEFKAMKNIEPAYPDQYYPVLVVHSCYKCDQRIYQRAKEKPVNNPPITVQTRKCLDAMSHQVHVLRELRLMDSSHAKNETMTLTVSKVERAYYDLLASLLK